MTIERRLCSHNALLGAEVQWNIAHSREVDFFSNVRIAPIPNIGDVNGGTPRTEMRPGPENRNCPRLRSRRLRG